MEEPGQASYRVVQLMSFWEIPGAVLLSFTAHLVIMLLASIRRHNASGFWMVILWGAYQLANWVAPYALNNISPCGKTMSPRQQLHAFWAMFLLHNLGGPDNMSGFSLEDNALYWREALLAVSRVVGASYVLYKHSYPGSGAGALIPASIIVLVVGAAKYAERVWALRQGHLGNMRGSSKMKPSESFTACASPGLDSGSLIRKGMADQLDDEEALMVAHTMFRFCKRALADSSVIIESTDDDYELDTSRQIFTLSLENMCNVVEMELSLMYDILYTKAAVIHASYGIGYIIRFASPLAIGFATVLFGFYYNKEGQTTADVIITYILLLATLLLDTRWLLRALGSTWTHAFLQVSGPCRCFRHAVLCCWKWIQIRHFVVFLDLRWRLRLTGPPRSPSSYRRWSGIVGQYGLLQQCTREISRCGKVAKAVGLEVFRNKYQQSKGHKLSQDVKLLVIARVTEVLESTYKVDSNGRLNIMKDITTSWGQVTTSGRPKELKELKLAFGREFQEDILVWHMATQIFLLCRDDKSEIHDKNAVTNEKAIKALSEYLMFLMAVRPHMLPGFTLGSLYEATVKSLQDIWKEPGKLDIGFSWKTGEEKLARTLLHKKENHSDWGIMGVGNSRTRLVSDGVTIAAELRKVNHSDMPKLLELVVNIWVDKLLYASTRCSRESHARQLGHGGDLTTIIWIMAEHAGLFGMGEPGPDDNEGSNTEDLPQPHQPMSPPQPMHPPSDGGYMWPWPQWSQIFLLQPVDEDPPPPPAPAPIIPPQRRTKKTARYATLYPVD